MNSDMYGVIMSVLSQITGANQSINLEPQTDEEIIKRIRVVYPETSDNKCNSLATLYKATLSAIKNDADNKTIRDMFSKCRDVLFSHDEPEAPKMEKQSEDNCPCQNCNVEFQGVIKVTPKKPTKPVYTVDYLTSVMDYCASKNYIAKTKCGYVLCAPAQKQGNVIRFVFSIRKDKNDACISVYTEEIPFVQSWKEGNYVGKKFIKISDSSRDYFIQVSKGIKSFNLADLNLH